MKRFLLLFLVLPVFAAPSTPITRGRLTTDLDAGGHTVTNSNLATTNFVWEVVGGITNNLPSGGGGGITTNDVKAIVADATNGFIRVNEYGIAVIPGEANIRDGINISNGGITSQGGIVSYGSVVANMQLSAPSLATDEILLDGREIDTVFAARTNLPPLSASATVGDLVDRVNAVIGALR